MIKYEHSDYDAGLSCTNVKIKKLRTFQELWEKNEKIHNKSEQHQGFRDFREFKDISEVDVIVTIEYYTNFHEHMGIHQTIQYAQQLLNEILAKFPIVKVILYRRLGDVLKFKQCQNKKVKLKKIVYHQNYNSMTTNKLDVYEITIEETNDFRSKNHRIDIFKLISDDQSLDQLVELEKQTHSYNGFCSL